MRRALAVSLLFHLVIGISIGMIMEIPRKESDPVTIEIIGPRSGHGKTRPKESIGVLKPRFSSDGPDPGKVSVGELALAQNYIERIHGLIDPRWRANVGERIRLRRLGGLPMSPCQSRVTLMIDKNGVLKKVVLTGSCYMDKTFDGIAVEAFDYVGQLPPPPKEFLESGVLTIEWIFEINK